MRSSRCPGALVALCLCAATASAELAVVGKHWDTVKPSLVERVEGLLADSTVTSELVWIESWNRSARERLDELGIQLAILVNEANGEQAGATTKEYRDMEGGSTKVKYRGAKIRIGLELFRLTESGDWESWGTWGVEKESEAAMLISSEQVRRGTYDEDVEAFLAKHLTSGLEACVNSLAGRVLWDAREWVRAPETAADMGTRARLLPLLAEAVSRSIHAPVNYPRASVVAAASGMWAGWSLPPGPEATDRCGWCASRESEPCKCPPARDLQLLLEVTDTLLRPPKPLLSPSVAEEPVTAGLRGDRPHEALRATPAVRAQLERIVDQDLELARNAVFDQRHTPDPPPVVLIVTDEPRQEWLDKLDPDFLSLAWERMHHRPETYDNQLRRWGVRTRMPVAGILERNGSNSNARKLLHSVDARSLDSSSIEILLERVLWSEFQVD